MESNRLPVQERVVYRSNEPVDRARVLHRTGPHPVARKSRRCRCAPDRERVVQTTILRILAAMAAAAACGDEPTTPTDSPPDESEPVALELYSPPRSVSRATPTYPRVALRNNREGWVRLDFMVDADGDPYEVAVTESVGHDSFHQAAIRAWRSLVSSRRDSTGNRWMRDITSTTTSR